MNLINFKSFHVNLFNLFNPSRALAKVFKLAVTSKRLVAADNAARHLTMWISQDYPVRGSKRTYFLADGDAYDMKITQLSFLYLLMLAEISVLVSTFRSKQQFKIYEDKIGQDKSLE